MKVFAILLSIVVAAFALAQQPPKSAQVQAPTQISADLGSCRVDFKVTDLLGKPLYNAKITTVIRHGFLNKRKLTLEVGTNADGRARFVKMPDETKDPIEFRASYGSDTATITWDPGNNCEAEYPILLGKKTDQQL